MMSFSVWVFGFLLCHTANAGSFAEELHQRPQGFVPVQATWHRSNTWMAQKVQIQLPWASERGRQEPAGQLSLSGPEQVSLCPWSEQLHGWMSPREGGVQKKQDRGEGEVRSTRKIKMKIQCDRMDFRISSNSRGQSAYYGKRLNRWQ